MSRSDPLAELRERYALGDFYGALTIAEGILEDLAAGLCHEIGNPLAAILSTALLLDHLELASSAARIRRRSNAVKGS